MTTAIPPATLGGVLRHYRMTAGLSREQVGVAVGRSTAAIRDWEQNASAPRFPLLIELASLYGVPMAQLAAEASGEAATQYATTQENQS
ncbi:MAG: helix-turn-helix domain-containing protein [Mycobacterium sp.]